MITDRGRLAWQAAATDYGQRALIETTMGRYKVLIGPRLRARGFRCPADRGCDRRGGPNRMLAAGRPVSVRSHGDTNTFFQIGSGRERHCLRIYRDNDEIDNSFPIGTAREHYLLRLCLYRE
jgi:hypothetical protein